MDVLFHCRFKMAAMLRAAHHFGFLNLLSMACVPACSSPSSTVDVWHGVCPLMLTTIINCGANAFLAVCTQRARNANARAVKELAWAKRLDMLRDVAAGKLHCTARLNMLNDVAAGDGVKVKNMHALPAHTCK
jgi:hypothetical protein